MKYITAVGLSSMLLLSACSKDKEETLIADTDSSQIEQSKEDTSEQTSEEEKDSDEINVEEKNSEKEEKEKKPKKNNPKKESKADKQAKSELNDLIGAVKEINSEYVILESRDRRASAPIFLKHGVEKDKNFEYSLGDIVQVYFKDSVKREDIKIYDVQYVDVIKKHDDVKVNVDFKGENEIGFEDIDFYQFPILSVSKGGKAKELDDDKSAMLQDIMNSLKWKEGLTENHKEEISILDEIETIATYDSSTKTFNDKKNKIHLQLSSNMAKVVDGIIK